MEKTSANKTDAKLFWIRLSGAAVQNAAVLRKRWRPAAAHTRFSSSKADDDIRLWVMDSKHAGAHSAATVYWGSKEGLTFAESWEKKTDIAMPREGANRITISGAEAGKPLFIRVLLKNDEGQFWSTKTLIAK